MRSVCFPAAIRCLRAYVMGGFAPIRFVARMARPDENRRARRAKVKQVGIFARAGFRIALREACRSPLGLALGIRIAFLPPIP